MATVAAPSAFAPFAQVSRFEYLNTAVVKSRVRGLYKLMLRGDYSAAKVSITDMLVNLTTALELDFDRPAYNIIYDAFARMRVELALRKYVAVHDRLRDLHYAIENMEEDLMRTALMAYVLDRPDRVRAWVRMQAGL